MKDLYFEENYGKLYENIENGTCETYEYHHVLGTVRHMFIKRLIPVLSHAENYFDLVTPYGYGGPVILNCTNENKQELVEEFQTAFEGYCKKNNIVNEFVRFHPVLQNAPDFSGCYDLTFRRKTIGINLKDYDDPIQSEFSKSKQKSIQKSLKAGVEYKITINPCNLDDFQRMYFETMERKKADEVYFFGEKYFSRLLKYLGDHVLMVEIIHEGEVIGMGLNFIYGKMIHIHLSGTRLDSHHLAPSVMLRYALVKWGKENGMELIHEGGGKSGSPDDPLYVFKKQFGKNTEFNYYVSYKVWNEKIYEMLCNSVDADNKVGVFPTYQ
ncbi:GNAT family N-acetyltransferase [Metaplanococcus flavidus]|uniref:Lipid II:glycine glycyltransferase n=1 Tax=Metaplanococcus flavidus TaxID=569883 RepID=A0ABW3L9V1_9BACL